MKFSRFLVLFLLILQSCTGQSKKINGLSFVASSKKVAPKHIKQVQKVSANYVALMPFAFIRDLSSPKVVFSFERQWFGETKKGILQYSSSFQKENIKVMLKPQIWVSRGQYTGHVKMNSEENWKVLETSYKDFILYFAKTAAELNVDIFCIGTELEQFVANRPTFWYQLIKEVRKIYKGKITYAANWDEFKRVPFWNELDYIGVDAYFPLSDKKSPTIQEFEEGWQPHKTLINQVHQKHNKPVLFTEFGYRSVDFTGKEPWDSSRISGQINLENQTKALQATYNQFWKEDWFAGGFIWKWFLDHERVGGNNNNRFTPQNKPAEELLSKLYAQ